MSLLKNHIKSTLFILFLFSPMLSFEIIGQADKEKIIIGEYRTIHSSILKEKRRIWVHLPKNYSKSNRSYPVIYKCDALGVSLFAGRVRDLGSFSLRTKVPEMILISIENTDRQRDMFPAKYKSIQPGAQNFLSFFEQELIPFVEKNYRAEQYRILMGESNSALFAVYAFLKKPELFGGFIASSPELEPCFDFLENLAKTSLSKKNYQNKKLYIIYGDKDLPRIKKSVPKFTKILDSCNSPGLKWQQNLLKNEGHVPDTSFKNGLLYIFDGYSAPADIIKKGSIALDRYYKNFNKKMGYKFKPNSYAWYKYAKVLLRNKEKGKSLNLLSKLFLKDPGDPFAFSFLFSMANIHRTNKDFKKAIDYFQKAKEYSPAMAEFFDIKIEKLKEK